MSVTTKFGVNARVQVVNKSNELYGTTGIIRDIGFNREYQTFEYLVSFPKGMLAQLPEQDLDRPSIILTPSGINYAG